VLFYRQSAIDDIIRNENELEKTSQQLMKEKQAKEILDKR
jgi:hypothetical protein